MKRAVDTTQMCQNLEDNYEPNCKVILVEKEETPLGISLHNPIAVGKNSHVDSTKFSGAALNMKNVHDSMADVYEESRLSCELHNVTCNFVKRPGHIYHLYERPSGQKYLGMLSPEEWQNAPHTYLGSFMLKSDSNWTSMKYHNRYNGTNFLQQRHGILHEQTLTY